MENYGWRYCKEEEKVSRTKEIFGVILSVIIILALGLSLGVLLDKELFKEVYKDMGREEVIKELSDILKKIPEEGGVDRFMPIPSPRPGETEEGKKIKI